MKQKQLKISDLIPDNKNYNKGNQFGNSLIEKSLRKNGAGRSILLDKNNRIIAGNKTIENAASIGMEDIIIVETTGSQIVCVKRMDIDLDSKQGREMALSDNATAKANIEWYFEELNADWSNDEQAEWGIINDFKIEEAEEDDFDVPEGGSETDIVLGDLFEIGSHRLLCGDSTCSDTVARLMNGEKADMVFTDPPYGMGYKSNGWDSNKKNLIGSKNNETILGDDNTEVGIDAIRLCKLFIKENVHLFFWCRWDSFNDFAKVAAEFSKVKGNIVWDKGDAPGLGDLECSFGGNEMAVHSITGRRKIKKRINSVWQSNRPKGLSMTHPTQKPIEIINPAIDNCTDINDLILDLFLGSGSTMVAAHQLKRKCYGMELSERYVQVIVDRMKKLDPTLVIKKNGEIIL